MPNKTLQLTSEQKMARCARLISPLATERRAFGGLARDVGLAVRWLTVILLV